MSFVQELLVCGNDLLRFFQGWNWDSGNILLIPQTKGQAGMCVYTGYITASPCWLWPRKACRKSSVGHTLVLLVSSLSDFGNLGWVISTWVESTPLVIRWKPILGDERKIDKKPNKQTQNSPKQKPHVKLKWWLEIAWVLCLTCDGLQGDQIKHSDVSMKKFPEEGLR